MASCHLPSNVLDCLNKIFNKTSKIYENKRLIQVICMLGHNMHRDDEAVSPVIATVLLLSITVLLSSMVFVMMSSTLDTVEKADPKASVSVRALSNGYHVVSITSLDQGP